MRRFTALFVSIAITTVATGAQAGAPINGSVSKVGGQQKIVGKKKAGKASRQKPGVNFSGMPTARIRGSGGEGLGPLAFARWIGTHARLAGVERASLRSSSSATKLLNRSANHFAEADADGNGRISAIELADFLASAPLFRTASYRV